VRQHLRIRRLLQSRSVTRTLLKDRLGHRQLRQSLFSPRDLVPHDQAIGPFTLIHVLCQRKQHLHLSAQVGFQFDQPLVAERLTL